MLAKFIYEGIRSGAGGAHKWTGVSLDRIQEMLDNPSELDKFGNFAECFFDYYHLYWNPK